MQKKYGLSRSTLLYYDSIGLLRPSVHEKGEYRFYGALEEQRLEKICRYRKAGIPLKDIKKILDSPDTSFTQILHDRFAKLNNEILHLHDQQRIIAGLLKNSEMIKGSKIMTKELWVSLLQASGFNETDMRKWHAHFERTAPEQHRIFLEQLQIPEGEIERIRREKP